MKIIRAAEQPLRDGTSSPLVSRRLVTPDDTAVGVALSWVRLSGAHARQNSGGGQRLYYVLSGEAQFDIEGGASGRAAAGDVVVVPPHVDYTFEGFMEYLYVNIPEPS
jgi:quercetin dioxygenase-like cupin family protein